MERLKLKRGHSDEETKDDWEVASATSSTPGHRPHHHTPEASPRFADERGTLACVISIFKFMFKLHILKWL